MYTGIKMLEYWILIIYFYSDYVLATGVIKFERINNCRWIQFYI